MNNSLLVVLIASGVAYGTPLLYAALGELLAERSGVLNLGVEGMMLIGAVMGFWTVQRVHIGSGATLAARGLRRTRRRPTRVSPARSTGSACPWPVPCSSACCSSSS